jgi:hypothetical protein
MEMMTAMIFALPVEFLIFQIVCSYAAVRLLCAD